MEYYDRMSAIREAAENLSIAYNTVSSAVGRFEILGILSLVKKQGRNKVYSYEEYIDILRSGDEDEIMIQRGTKYKSYIVWKNISV